MLHPDGQRQRPAAQRHQVARRLGRHAVELRLDAIGIAGEVGGPHLRFDVGRVGAEQVDRAAVEQRQDLRQRRVAVGHRFAHLARAVQEGGLVVPADGVTARAEHQPRRLRDVGEVAVAGERRAVQRRDRRQRVAGADQRLHRGGRIERHAGVDDDRVQPDAETVFGAAESAGCTRRIEAVVRRHVVQRVVGRQREQERQRHRLDHRALLVAVVRSLGEQLEVARHREAPRHEQARRARPRAAASPSAMGRTRRSRRRR